MSVRPYYILTGLESHLKSDFLDRLKQECHIEGASNYFYIAYDADDDPGLTGLSDELLTHSLIAGKKILYVKNFERALDNAKDMIRQHLTPTPSDNILVIDVEELTCLDPLPGQTAREQIISCSVASSDDLARLARTAVEGSGKTLKEDALEYLQAACGYRWGEIKQNIEKLISFTGAKQDITKEDISEVVADNRLEDTFHMTEAIASKDTRETWLVLSKLLKQGESPMELIGWLAWHFRRVWTVKSMLAHSYDPFQISKRVNIPQKYFESFARRARSFNAKNLGDVFRRLLAADEKLKSSGQDEKLIIETLCFELCRT